MGDFWSSRKVVVTGGSGFLGSHLVAILRERGCQNVFVPRRQDYDLTQWDQTQKLFRDVEASLVIHLAAVVGGIGANRKNPGTFFRDNLLMGVHTMEAARLAQVKKFVAVGTICAYPRNTPVPFHEENLWNGYPEETNAPYGLAKKMLLVQAQAYRQEFAFNAIYVLPVNLYGPRDNFDLESSHVIPAMIRKFVEAKRYKQDKVILWGTGQATREFLYVEDCAQAIALFAEHYEGDQPVNIGSGREISIKDLAQRIANQVGFHGEVLWDATKPDGQPRRCLDVSRAEKLVGFRARTSLEEGLQRTIDSYLAEHA